jgi:hypothetical protein
VNTTLTRSILVVPVALAALAGLAGCGAEQGAGSGSDAAAPTAAGDASASAADTVELTADGAAAGKCAMPSAETLASFDTAFSGTVTSLDGGTATLDVDQWYAGGEGSTVTVDAPSKDLQDLLMAVDFQEGRTYLVSATDGRVTLCGFTAEQSPDLQAIYDEAFGG